MGRHSDYTGTIADIICGRLAAGEPLVKICRDEAMPDLSTVYRWLAANPVFREKYARAREDQADTLADQIVDIADADPATLFKRDHGEGPDVVMVDGAAIAHQRLRVDARKWTASKLKPKKYGDKMEHEHAGTVNVIAAPHDENL